MLLSTLATPTYQIHMGLRVETDLKNEDPGSQAGDIVSESPELET